MLLNQLQISAVLLPEILSIVKHQLFFLLDVFDRKIDQRGLRVHQNFSDTDIWLPAFAIDGDIPRLPDVGSKIVEVSRFISRFHAAHHKRVVALTHISDKKKGAVLSMAVSASARLATSLWVATCPA